LPITEAELHQFTGTERYYRHGLFRKILYTDGAHYVAEKAGAYWLLDAMAAAQCDRRVRAEEFQLWKLEVHKDQSARLTCEDGNENTVYTQRLEFTTFPLDSIQFYLENNVIMLPSER
jgi:hypothetical protein